MTLCVVIGNTNTRLAWFDGPRIVRRAVQPTAAPPRLARPGALSGAALASVVPAAAPGWVAALRRAGASPLLLAPRTRTGLRFRYDRRQLGADRVCAAVGAHERYPGNVTFVDFGTAVTVNVVTRQGIFAGGFIVPGPDALFAALAGSTAQLPRVGPTRPCRSSSIPRATRAAIRSGITTLIADGVGGIIARAIRSVGRPCRVVATGGRARDFARLIPAIDLVETDLALHGLHAIHRLDRVGRR